ncbi:Uncharacterised protein [Legionella pneumophila]|uniref:hypothetical protein n=1 Tax=Legionella pneumophila TaxID=446 RepID=UPI0005C9DB78|nr:hypothetical protein [Legionella pneumophila]HAT8827787.1 hypothetical protein [Legionella pneumophila subsp. pneumophila]WAI79307.1 hypothetical protein OXA86_00360 [Legionella pneumophila]CZG74049.1 Uncharacterised protein [Legionella pneumophila]CZH98518.1 Uncharacterised protein [Legionella pneumophila]HAT4692805.1 hypothetical protein [Legionella pneumophila]
MSRNSLPAHIEGLFQYLGQPHEKANEDLALGYFRKIFPDFTRQSDASRSDGYVKGHFVLELKGKTKDWYSGLFQGLAYKRDLDFSVIVVATKGFLGVWKANDIPNEIIEACLTTTGASSTIGKKIASDYKHLEKQIFEKAIWSDDQMYLLLNENKQYFVDKIASFESTLKSCQKVRSKITPTNFTKVLKELAQFFDPTQPIKTVAAFYTMIYSWGENSIVSLSNRDQTQASLLGEAIRYLIPGRRIEFKKFVENYYIDQSKLEDLDEYFAQYDKAIDSVDKNFRVQHGVYFTDLNLSKFVMWLVKQTIPDLGKNYIVIDPACGSGNLVTNWRSPLELRHKIVSELEPDLLYAVDQRLKKDPWHAGRFTVVPKVGSGEGLNFLDKSAKEYIEIIEKSLKEKGKKFDKPIAFLCNPPYRGEDDTSAESIDYSIHQSIIDCIGKEGQAERYSCFLAQMKLICDQAVESGLPGDTKLLLFTKSTWLTNRKSFSKLKQTIFNSFGYMGGALFDGKEFFDLKGKFPIAFTIWSYKRQEASCSENWVELRDLTWLKKKQLCEVDWKESIIVNDFCERIISDKKTILIPFGMDRKSIKDWVALTRKDLIRNRRKTEVGDIFCGGLPKDDMRIKKNKSVYGYRDGDTVGFMEDLTPCRTFSEMNNVPWFTLDVRFMRARSNRCFSGQPDSRGYCASNYINAKKLFFWYALTKTFVDNRPPMWTDAMQIWAPSLKGKYEKVTNWYSFAIGFAENDCIETFFPANNPTDGLKEIYCSNPMSPNNPESFWSKIIFPNFLKERDEDSVPNKLVNAVLDLYKEWQSRFQYTSEIKVSYKKKYFIGEGSLTANAGIIQIQDYARERGDQLLLDLIKNIRSILKTTKESFYELLTNSHQINYFGASLQDEVNDSKRIFPINEVRLTLGTMIVKSLFNSKGFGKTKFAKVFYIADMMSKKNLKTKYYREVAGPVDYNILYNKNVSIEKLASDKGYFTTDQQEGKRVKYTPGKNIDEVENLKKEIFGNELEEIEKIINKFKNLNTDQAEVVATLFACWNDLLIDKKEITDEIIIDEFQNNWHLSKKRFPKQKLLKILQRMKEHNIIPQGIKGHTYIKSDKKLRFD